MFRCQKTITRKSVYVAIGLCLAMTTTGKYIGVSAWHAYDSALLKAPVGDECPSYEEATKPYSYDFIQKLKLWPDMMSNYDMEKGETIYGSRQGLEAIFANQHPPNCSEAQYLISGGWPFGFGSRIHMEGIVLGMAMHMNRVYLPHPNGDNFFWETDIPFCRKGRNEPGMSCFYEAYSNCTIVDALKAAGVSSVDDLPTMFMGDFAEAFESPQGQNRLRKAMKFKTAYNVVMTYGGAKWDGHKYIPRQVKPIIECSPMRRDALYYWWRAVSAAYIARPNQLTLNMLSRYTTLQIQEYSECVAMFVRHGDKGVEMRLLDFTSYQQTAQLLWDSGLVPASQHFISSHNHHEHRDQRRHLISSAIDKDSSSGSKEEMDNLARLAELSSLRYVVPFNGSLFITTEDPDVLAEAEEFGRNNHWGIFYTNLFDRKIQTAYKTWDEQHKQGTAPVHDDLEYISMLLNLYYSTRCGAWVCTMASNSCRLMDEFRATVGAKAGGIFADLSIESCPSPPCLVMNEIASFRE